MPKNIRNSEKNAYKIEIVAAILCLCILPPKCWGYSITSSLGPSFEYEPFSPVTGASRIQPSESPSPAPKLMLSAVGLETPQDSGGSQQPGYSHYIYSRQSDGASFRRPFLRRQIQDQSQYTSAQLHIASRIQYESRLFDMTTAKPQLGYRSFPSSYRNPNYFGKKTKVSDSRTNVKRFFPNFSGDNVDVLAAHESILRTHVETPKYNSALFPAANSNPVTTPESRTAPATILSSSATERPSSTQQMQSDGSYYSAGLDGSASTNHYHLTNSGGQQTSNLGEEARSLQILPPNSRPPANVPNSSSSAWRHFNTSTQAASTTQKSHGNSSHFGNASLTSNFSSDRSREVEEEPIVFPTTFNPTQRTYKIPIDEDLSGLKNILQEGEGTDTHSKKELTNRRGSALPAKDLFGSSLEGVMDLDCAKSLGYCEKDAIKDNYPKELLNSVLTNSISSDLFKKVFGDVVEGSGLKTKGQASEDVVLAGRNNINVLTQETQLCVSQEVTIYPRVARNKDDKWMFVVNHDDYVQGVKVEKCMNEGGACPFSEGNPLGYESVCRQKYILRKLVALNDDGKTALDTFKLPSCCVCYIKSNYVSDRIGAVSSASRTPALSDNGVSASSPVRGSHAQHEEMNDSPVACADRVSSAPEKSSNSTTAPHLPPPPASNSSVAVNKTRRCLKAINI